MSFRLVSSAAALLGILLPSQCNCCGSLTACLSVLLMLPKADVIIMAGGLVVIYLTATCSPSPPAPHHYPAFPILHSHFYLLQSHDRKGKSWPGFGVRRVESWVPPEVAEARLPICLPTVPFPLWENSTSSPSEGLKTTACFQVLASHRHCGWCIMILSHYIFYCKCATLWLNCLIYTRQEIEPSL